MIMASSLSYGVLFLLSYVGLILSLTSKEAGMFESEEIPVIRGSDVHGHVAVGTNRDGDTHTLISNGIPDHAVDQSLNIQKQSFKMKFPQKPKLNEKPTCLYSSSIIGFATNGVPIFSPFDHNNKNLNAGIKTNTCQGRSTREGIYYYSTLPSKCSTFMHGVHDHDSGSIYGVAADGFPIYGPGEGGEITNDQLDACHGKEDADGNYAYYMNDEWPYILGCFRGTPVNIEGAPPAGENVCKFACNKRAKNDKLKCVDDFPIRHKEL